MPIITEQTAGHSKRVNLTKKLYKRKDFLVKTKSTPTCRISIPNYTSVPDGQAGPSSLRSIEVERRRSKLPPLWFSCDRWSRGKKAIQKKGWCRSCQLLASPRKHVPSTRKQKAHHNTTIPKLPVSNRPQNDNKRLEFNFLLFNLKG